MKDRDFYAILGVYPAATEREIVAAFRRRAKEYHPDKIAATGLDMQQAELFMRDLLKIVAVLRTPSRRAAYDRWRQWVARQEAAGGLVFTPDGFRVNIYVARKEGAGE